MLDKRHRLVTLDAEATSIDEVDLNGTVLRSVPFRIHDHRTELTPALPRFGIITYRIEMKH